MLDIKNLTATIEGKTILNTLSIQFEGGKTYALLGPNGSGKSTLWGAILGKSNIATSEDSVILFKGENILTLPPEKRFALGLFGTFQSPPPLPGVTILQLARAAFPKTSALELKNRIAEFARELDIPDGLLRRGLHDGFSGGEKKKFEALSFALFSPKVALFDELDTGVDVDALKRIALFLKKHRTHEQTFVFITHSPILFEAIPPDTTIVIKDGAIIESGDGSRAQEILNEEGFRKE